MAKTDIIETKRLILRRFKESDADEMYNLAKDPAVGPIAGWKPHDNPEESLEIIRNIFLPADSFAVTLREDGCLIGAIAFEKDRLRENPDSAEMGYWIGSGYWGNGYMTEAAEAFIEYGFKTKCLNQIGICTSIVNERSKRVIKKCGFVYEGTIRRTLMTYNGLLRDSLVFSMTAEEYEAKKSGKESC